jgi:glycosyltransferase involved in cell wall biosynthesis
MSTHVSPGDATRFSVVVPTYRRRESLRRVLRGLAEQAWEPDRLEVLVVSDGSDDGSVEMARTLPMPCALTVLEQANQGPAAARNLGIEKARGPMVLFLDDDVVPSPHLVAEHARAHRAASNLVVIGPMLQGDATPSPWVRWESDRLSEQYAAMQQGKWTATPWQFYTGNASLRLEHLRKAGGFDTRFRRAEDIELGFRLAGLGLQFVFHVPASGLHIADRTYASWIGSARQYGRNDIRFGKAEERVVSQFRYRNPLTRGLVRWGLRHPRLVHVVPPLARGLIEATDRLRLGAISRELCGAAFNLGYWLGVAEELGSARAAARLAESGSPPGLLSRARSALPIGARTGRQ